MTNPRPDMLLNDLCMHYINNNPRVRSKQTQVLIKTTVQQYQQFLGRAGKIADLSNENIIKFAEFRKQLGRSPRTIEREQSKMCTLWRWAASEGWCETPRFSVTKCAPPTPTAWSPDELKRVFAAAKSYNTRMKKIPGNIALPAILRLAYDTGERATAILQVQWSTIDLDRRWVTFKGDTRKGGVKAKDNTQRISRECVRALTALREWKLKQGPLDDRVFPEMHPTSVYGHLRFALQSAGLPHDRSCMLHKLRRTHATHLYMLGGDATQSLGHDSDAMTRGYYLDPRYTREGRHLAELNVGIVKRAFRKLKGAFGIL